jgi:transposase
VTHEDIVYDRRVRLIEYAARINNVAEACRVFGVSRKTYYEWLSKAERYGLSALLPRDRRTPHQPNAMSSEEVSIILAEAVARPTLGPKSLLRHLKAPVAWTGPRPGWRRSCGATTWAPPGSGSRRWRP